MTAARYECFRLPSARQFTVRRTQACEARKAPVREMLEEHAVGHEARHRDHLQAGPLHQHVRKTSEVGYAVAADQQVGSDRMPATNSSQARSGSSFVWRWSIVQSGRSDLAASPAARPCLQLSAFASSCGASAMGISGGCCTWARRVSKAPVRASMPSRRLGNHAVEARAAETDEVHMQLQPVLARLQIAPHVRG